MRILIGCPVYKREWILPQWFQAIEEQNFPAQDIGFVFELGTDDDETHQVIWDWQATHPAYWCFDAWIQDTEHRTHQESERNWQVDDYGRMAEMRNRILSKVNCYRPDRYLSLDSDILLEDPETLNKLVTATETFDAVSPLCYMWHDGKEYPNTMTWESTIGDRAYRVIGNYPLGVTFKTDVIMAAVMMKPSAYTTTAYQWHPQGEDLGWSASAGMLNLNLGLVSQVYAPHIMHRWMLERYESEGDNRGARGSFVKQRI